VRTVRLGRRGHVPTCWPHRQASPDAQLCLRPHARLRLRRGAEIGKAFAEHYYQTFDSQRVNLQTLYTDQSLLTFENEQFMGMQAIMTKLTVCAPPGCSLHLRPAGACACAALPDDECSLRRTRAAPSQTLAFQTVQHKITTSDSQPTPSGGILVMVTGDLAVDGNVTTPLKYAQTFHLMPNGSSWYIHNDIFRLNYG
jgi:hypothetical protein